MVAEEGALSWAVFPWDVVVACAVVAVASPLAVGEHTFVAVVMAADNAADSLHKMRKPLGALGNSLNQLQQLLHVARDTQLHLVVVTA